LALAVILPSKSKGIEAEQPEVPPSGFAEMDARAARLEEKS